MLKRQKALLLGAHNLHLLVPAVTDIPTATCHSSLMALGNLAPSTFIWA